MKLKFEVTIFNKKNDPTPYVGYLRDVSNYFNKLQVIPRIGDTIYFNKNNISITVPKPEDDKGYTSESITVNLNAVYAKIKSVGYDTYNNLISIHVYPSDFGYQRL